MENMVTVEEVVEGIKDLEQVTDGFMGYDDMVGGLVSSSITNLRDARKLLDNPTKANIGKALKLIQGVKDGFEPYAGYAEDLMKNVNSVIVKIKAL